MAPKSMLKIVCVEPLPGSHLRLVFENGEIRRFAMARFLARARGWFAPLRKRVIFRQVHLANGTVAWPNGANLDAGLLYEWSIPETSDLEQIISEEQVEAGEPEDLGLHSVVQLRRDLPRFGTVVELLNESTVLVEFADSREEAVELLPVPKALLARYDGVTHVTPAEGNVFLDLGFSCEDAAKFKADSDQRITLRIGRSNGMLEMHEDSEGYPRDSEWENLQEVGLEVWPSYEYTAISTQPLESDISQQETQQPAPSPLSCQLSQALELLILLKHSPWNSEARSQLDALQVHLRKVKPTVVASQLPSAWLLTKAALERSLFIEGDSVALPDKCPFCMEEVQGRNG